MTVTGATIDEVLARVEALTPELLETVTAAVRIPSVTPTYPGQSYDDLVGAEGEVARLLAERYRSAGAAVATVAGAPGRENAVGVIEGTGSGRSLILNGHVDVVPAGDRERWRGDPFSGAVADGNVWGRGAADMKAGLVAQAYAARALREAGVALRGDLVLQAVVGEETAERELGTEAVIEHGPRADAAIVAEPTGWLAELSIMPATPGLLGMTLEVAGRATHAALRGQMMAAGGPGSELGVSAIDKGMLVYEALRRLEEEWAVEKTHPLFPSGHFVIHPGIVAGQRRGALIPAFVPDELRLEYALFYPPGERADDIKREVEAQIEHASALDPWLRRHPPSVTWAFHCPPSEVPVDAPICEVLSEAAAMARGGEGRAEPARIDGFPSFCDSTWLCASGIPAVVHGPGALALAHADDEHCPVEEIVAATRTYALAAMAWCGQ